METQVNPEAILAKIKRAKYQREWIAKFKARDPEGYRKKRREYRQANIEKVKEYQRKWYQKNREKLNEDRKIRDKRYRMLNREKIIQYHREWYQRRKNKANQLDQIYATIVSGEAQVSGNDGLQGQLNPQGPGSEGGVNQGV